MQPYVQLMNVCFEKVPAYLCVVLFFYTDVLYLRICFGLNTSFQSYWYAWILNYFWAVVTYKQINWCSQKKKPFFKKIIILSDTD